MNALREVLAKLGVEVDVKQLDGAKAKIDKTIGLMKQLGIGMAAIGSVKMLAGFIEETAKAGVEVRNWSERLGMTTDEFQKYKFAAEAAGIKTTEFTMGMKFLGKHIGDALEGEKHATKMFGQLGIAVKDANGEARPMAEIMGDVADHFEKTKGKGTQLADAMHLMGKGGASMIPMLNQGGDAVRELFKDFDALGGGMSKRFIDAAVKFQRQMTRMNLVFQTFKSELALPALEHLSDVLINVGVWMIKLARHTTLAKTSLIALAVGAGVMLWSAFSPLILAAAGALALYLVFDDIFALFTGKRSLIGDVLDAFVGAGTAASFVKLLSDSLHLVWDILTDMFGGSSPNSAFTQWLKEIIPDAATIALEVIKDLLRFIMETIAEIDFMVQGVSAIGRAATEARRVMSTGGSVKEAAAAFYNNVTTDGANIENNRAIQQKRIDSILGGVGASKPMDRSKVESITGQGTRYPAEVNKTYKTEINNNFHGPADPAVVGPAVRQGVANGQKDAAAAVGDPW